MAKKKTAEELRKAADAAEQRARELRAKARKVTQAEEAKVNSDIIAALHTWLDAFPSDRRRAWNELPAYFREDAARRIEKRNGNGGGNAAITQRFE